MILDDYFENYDENKYLYWINKILINHDIHLISVKNLLYWNRYIYLQNDKLFLIICLIGDINIVKLLIENGADVHDDKAFINSCMNG